MKFLLCFLAILVAAATHAQATPNIFTSDVQMCSGRPWIDVTCNGADPTGAADSTTAISNTISTAVSNDWPVFFPAGTYKVTSKITVEFGGQANNGPQLISQGATLDGRAIASGNVFQIQCTGGTTASPVVCNHFGIQGWLTIMGSGAGYVATLGKTDFSDQQNGVRIEHLVVSNAGSGGAIQANYLTDGNLWLSGSTQGGSSSVAAVALEQVQTSKIGGYASALGASAPGILVENGATVGNSIIGFGYDPNDNTCISITSSTATLNAWLAPYLPCTVAINASAPASNNALIGPVFAGANRGPIADGISVIGRGTIYRYLAPAVSSLTLYGTDDGTMLSSANATGASTQFTAASLPVTLPSPSQVGVGWSAAFVSDNNKAIVLSTPSGSQIFARNQQLTSLTVGAAGARIGVEIAVLQSDGTNFRINYISQGAALMNGIESALPARWYYPGGPGYSATLADNGGIISSASTSGGLTVTLPSTTAIPVSWMVGIAADNGQSATVQVNGTSGGTILPNAIGTYPVGPGSILLLQFDGSNFRVILDTYAQPLMLGCWGDGTHDDTTCVNAALATSASLKKPVYLGNRLYKVSSLTRLQPYAGIIGSGMGSYVGGYSSSSALNCSSGFVASTANVAYLISLSHDNTLQNFCIKDAAAGTNTSGKAIDIETLCDSSGGCPQIYNDTVDHVLIDGPCIGVALTGAFINLTNNFIANIQPGGTNTSNWCGGIRIGAYTNSDRTLQPLLYNNTVYTNFTSPAEYSLLILDVGGPYITNNEFNVAYINEWIFPSLDLAASGAQVVQAINSSGNFLDFPIFANLRVDCGAGALVGNGGSVFNADWFGSAGQATGGTSGSPGISIGANGAGCHVAGLEINNARVTNSLGDGIVVSNSNVWNLSITNSHICGIHGNEGIYLGGGVGISGQGLAIENNKVGGSCDAYTTTLPVALNLSGNNFDLVITGNDFSSATTPVSLGGNTPAGNSLVSNNKGIDDVIANISSLSSWPLNPRILYSGGSPLSLPAPTYCCPSKTIVPTAGNVTLSGAVSVGGVVVNQNRAERLEYMGTDWFPQ